MRLHLPLFVLSAPVVAAAFSRAGDIRNEFWQPSVCSCSRWRSLLDTFAYQFKAWASLAGLRRLEMPAARRPRCQGDIGARRIRESLGCKRVGLDTAGAMYWKAVCLAILGVGTGGAYVRHINMGGPDDLSQYCAILSVACDSKPAQAARYRAAGIESAEEQGATLFYRSGVGKAGLQEGGEKAIESSPAAPVHADFNETVESCDTIQPGN